MGQYDVFISYRRDGGQFVAKSIQEELSQKKYNVFLDLESLRSGKFNMQLLGVIAECRDFLLILSPGALDRCCNEEDWVTKEVAAALRNGVNIIPVFMRNFTFPDKLPKEIEAIRNLKGITPNTDNLDDFTRDICAALASTPNSRQKPSAQNMQDIFLCCLHEDGKMAAQMVSKNLTQRGYRVTLDTESCHTGSFRRENLSIIRGCTDFIMLLSPGALDNCTDPSDWRYQACIHAISCGANIVPILLKGFEFPAALHPDLGELRYRNGVPFDIQFWDASIDRVTAFLHSKPRKDNSKHLIPAAAAVLVLALAAGVLHLINKKPDIPIPPTETTQAADETVPETTAEITVDTDPEETAAPAVSGSPSLMMNIPKGKKIDGKWSAPSVWGNEAISRENITKIRIVDTLDGAADVAWDVSKDKDGTVLCWVETNGSEQILTLAGQNGIQLPKDSSLMFAGFTSVRSITFSDHFLTDNVRDMNFMFYNCNALEELDVAAFNTSAVTDMHSMFAGCNSLKTLDLSGWNTEKVTDMYLMFQKCSALEAVNFQNFKTDSVINMQSMFTGCESLKTLDLSSWNTEKVTDMSHMFKNCSALEAVNFQNFKTDSVTTMYAMFAGCESLKTLDLNDWKISNVSDMGYLFYKCSSLETLNIDSWDISGVAETNYMFYGCNIDTPHS